MQSRHEVAVDAVTQTTLLPHFLGQARGKAATTQDVVAHGEGEEVRIVALVAGLTDEHMGLCRLEGNALLTGQCQRRHYSHRRQRCAVALGQTGQQGAHQRIGLCPRHGTHQADLGTTGRHAGAVG